MFSRYFQNIENLTQILQIVPLLLGVSIKFDLMKMSIKFV